MLNNNFQISFSFYFFIQNWMKKKITDQPSSHSFILSHDWIKYRKEIQYVNQNSQHLHIYNIQTVFLLQYISVGRFMHAQMYNVQCNTWEALKTKYANHMKLLFCGINHTSYIIPPHIFRVCITFLTHNSLKCSLFSFHNHEHIIFS